MGQENADLSGEGSPELRRRIADLLKAVKEGSRDALLQLLEYAQEKLRAIASYALQYHFPSVRAHHNTDSVLNRIWISAIVSFDADKAIRWLDPNKGPATEAEFLAWVRTAIRSKLIDLARQIRLAPRSLDEDGTGGTLGGNDPDTPPDILERAERMERFWEKVGQLTPEQKAVFDLKYILGVRTYKEIAQALGTSISTVFRLWQETCDFLSEG